MKTLEKIQSAVETLEALKEAQEEVLVMKKRLAEKDCSMTYEQAKWIVEAVNTVGSLDGMHDEYMREGGHTKQITISDGMDFEVTLPYGTLDASLTKIRDKYARKLKTSDYCGEEAKCIYGGDSNADDGKGTFVNVPGAKFPLYWDKEYYAAVRNIEIDRRECGVCGGEGRIKLLNKVSQKETEYTCPNCQGGGTIGVVNNRGYQVKAYSLLSAERRKNSDGYTVTFSTGAVCDDWIVIGSEGLPNMEQNGRRVIFETRKEAEDEVARLNAELKKEAIKSE